jgi:RHS repeat-associated protein
VEAPALPSACTLGTQGTGTGDFGPDRIVKTTYDAAGQVTKTTSAYGITGQQADDATLTYTSNGKTQTVKDAENNLTTYQYDGHDGLAKTYFPSATKGAGSSNGSDYEELGFDAGSNVTSLRNRAGQTISLSYDALNRLTLKDLPDSGALIGDGYYRYDNVGRLTSISTDPINTLVSFSYDGLGRVTQENHASFGAKTFAYDLAGRRTRMTWKDGVYVDYDYLVTGETEKIRENGATSEIGVLATFAYDDLGRRTSLTRGNGTVTSYGYDAVSRLTSLGQDFAGTTHDLTLGFGYTPAGQIASNTRSNDLYAWTGHGSGTTSATANGLNQLTANGSATLTYDTKGNLTNDGTRAYTFASDNRLATGGAGGLYYDPLARLSWYQNHGGLTDYAGSEATAELENGTYAFKRRFVFGPGTDEPIVWYEGTGTSDRRFLHADERGSIVAVSNGSGAVTNINTYDEYGKPGAGNDGRFQYTGQRWIGEIGLYDYKARMYDPRLGRFLQPDSIGYGAGRNRYA